MSSHLTQRSRAECLVTLKMSHQRSIRGQNLFQGILFGDDDSTVREHSMSAADLSNFKSALRTKMNDSLLKRINDVEGMDVLIPSLFYRGCTIRAVSQKRADLLFPMHARGV